MSDLISRQDIVRELKSVCQYITWLYDDGKIEYDDAVKLMGKITEIAKEMGDE